MRQEESESGDTPPDRIVIKADAVQSLFEGSPVMTVGLHP